MQARIIDIDLADNIDPYEKINVVNFPGIENYVNDVYSVIEYAEMLQGLLRQLLAGQIKSISTVTPSQIRSFGDTCRTLCDNLGNLTSAKGATPIHLIRIVREIQTSALLIAITSDLFSEDKLQDFNDVWR